MATATTERRDAYFDNAKYLVIVLVACGHAWEPLTHTGRAVHAAYLTVYAFHMPAFALISGYLSRSYDAGPRRTRRLVAGVLIPYLVFETAYSLFARYTMEPGNPISLMDPWYVMWFLVALFIWRLTAPVWQQLRYPVPIALAIATLAAASPGLGGELALQRVLGFLPYFVLGLRLRPEHFAVVRNWPARLVALSVVAVTAVGCYAVAPWFNTEWLYHRDSVDGFGAARWTAVVAVPALFCLALLLTGCLLAWVPGRRLWFTRLGTGTLYGYLLHGFLVKAIRWWGWYDHPWLHTPLGELAVTGCAAVVITLLCTPPVRRAFRGVVEPPLSWAFRDRTAPA
ncbi:acyltransferase family protein [Streptomyces boninensis]|uniref:acyltransferase family protein n=1 Tax=Streptomyces boninensis TaxID=2039455 RepID=UPI003B21C5D8